MDMVVPLTPLRAHCHTSPWAEVACSQALRLGVRPVNHIQGHTRQEALLARVLRSAPRSVAQQGGAPAETQTPERQKEALKVMGKPRATNHRGKRGAGCAHSTKDLEQDGEPSSTQQRAAKKKVRTS